MHHSMRSHPAVTATLLDFLCRVSESHECCIILEYIPQVSIHFKFVGEVKKYMEH
jgi:hypothetical protein